MVKSKLPPQSGSSLEAVEPHPKKGAIKFFDIIIIITIIINIIIIIIIIIIIKLRKTQLGAQEIIWHFISLILT